MVAPVGPQQRHALAAVFVEFACLPDLFALLLRERGTVWGPDARRSYDRGPDSRDPEDPPPDAWEDFFRERPPNVDHIHDDPIDYLWSGDRDVPRALCEEAWALVQRLRLVVWRRFSRAGHVLARIGRQTTLETRTADDHAILRGILRRRVERRYVGAGGVPIVPVLQTAAHEFGQDDSRASAYLPGLLAGEMTCLIELARTDADAVLMGRHRLRVIREEAMQALGEPDPGEEPSWYRIDLADAVNGRNLAELPSRTEDPFTLTQVRATAQLLTYCGLLHEAFPLGPVQCLAAGR